MYKRQALANKRFFTRSADHPPGNGGADGIKCDTNGNVWACLLYTSDAADERSSVDLGGRRIIKKKNRA